MFDWLFEGRFVVYVILGGLALLALLLYNRDRKWRWIVAAGVFAALMGGYFLLDSLVETGREQVRRKLTEMAAAVGHRDVDRLMSHVSDEFHLGKRDKAGFREYADDRRRQNFIEEVVVWDFVEPADWSGKRVTVTMMAKAKGSRLPEYQGGRVDAEFVHDPDGQWRLAGFTVFDPREPSQPVPEAQYP
jgi:hypothetical protein